MKSTRAGGQITVMKQQLLRIRPFADPGLVLVNSLGTFAFLCYIKYCYLGKVIKLVIRRRDVVGRVPAFKPGGPGSIPGGMSNFNSYPGIGCVSFVFCPVLSSAEGLTLC